MAILHSVLCFELVWRHCKAGSSPLVQRLFVAILKTGCDAVRLTARQPSDGCRKLLKGIYLLDPRFQEHVGCRSRSTVLHVDEILLRLSRPLFLFLFLRISFLSDIVLFDLLVDGKRVRFFFRRLDSSSHLIVVVREYVSLTLSLAPFKCTAWMRVSCISYFVSCIVYRVLCIMFA